MLGLRTKLAALLFALCLIAPIRLHAQSDAYPNIDERGRNYQPYNGGRLYEDGTTAGTFDDIAGAAHVGALRSAMRADAVLRLLHTRYGVKMTADDYRRILASNLPSCRFTPQPDVESRTLEGMSGAAKTPAERGRMADFYRACLARIRTVRGADKALPDDMALPFGIALCDAYAIYDGVKRPSDPAFAYMILAAHVHLAQGLRGRTLDDTRKQQADTVLTVVAGEMDLILGAVFNRDRACLGVFRASDQPLPTPQQARQEAADFLRRNYLKEFTTVRLTSAGLFPPGQELTYRDGMWFEKGH